MSRRLPPIAGLMLAMMLALQPVRAATLKATLITPEDDPRLERTRLDRASLGHDLRTEGDLVRESPNGTRLRAFRAGSRPLAGGFERRDRASRESRRVYYKAAREV